MFKDFESIKIGDTAALVKKITEQDIRKFVEMTGDDNPLHVNRAYAETTPFKDIVVHGMLGASFVSTIIGTKLPGKGALWISQSFDFLLPVRLNDELTVSCTVTGKFDKERILELEATIRNQSKALVLSGRGKVKVLPEAAVPAVESAVQKKFGAVVTGGSGGIGRAICLRLARDGYGVVVNYLGNAARAAEIVAQIERAGGRAAAFQADVSRPGEAAALVDRAVRLFGGIGLLVNNASPKIGPCAFEQMEWSDIQTHLDGQLKAAFLSTKACVPLMRTQGRGKIVNITSQVIDANPSPTWTAYAVGKSSLATFSRYLAAELGPSKIAVNCVSPGMTDTAMIGDIPEKTRLIAARQTPLRRLARPEDVAGAVAFLASDEADFITGETIRVNGGQSML